MSKRKCFEVYEDPKGSSQWYFDVPGVEPYERIKTGPYPTKDQADWEASEAETAY